MRAALLLAAVVSSTWIAACRSEPDHHVICTQARNRRAEAGKGTPNDRQVRCHGLVQQRMKSAPSTDHVAFADCVLEAEDDEAAGKCK